MCLTHPSRMARLFGECNRARDIVLGIFQAKPNIYDLTYQRDEAAWRYLCTRDHFAIARRLRADVGTLPRRPPEGETARGVLPPSQSSTGTAPAAMSTEQGNTYPRECMLAVKATNGTEDHKGGRGQRATTPAWTSHRRQVGEQCGSSSVCPHCRPDGGVSAAM